MSRKSLTFVIKCATLKLMSANVILVEDLPIECLEFGSVAIDTETMGLNLMRDRLCLVQLCFGTNDCYVIKIVKNKSYPNLLKLLKNSNVKKIFHFARFDLAVLNKFFNIKITNIFCTKIASKLARTYTSKHGLKDLCAELLNCQISKEEQTSYWGAQDLRESQLAYAATDVVHLHELRDILTDRLKTENRTELADLCFNALETVVELDMSSYDFSEIFNH